MWLYILTTSQYALTDWLHVYTIDNSITSQYLQFMYNKCMYTIRIQTSHFYWNYMSNTANIYLTVWDKQTTPKALE